MAALSDMPKDPMGGFDEPKPVPALSMKRSFKKGRVTAMQAASIKRKAKMKIGMKPGGY